MSFLDLIGRLFLLILASQLAVHSHQWGPENDRSEQQGSLNQQYDDPDCDRYLFGYFCNFTRTCGTVIRWPEYLFNGKNVSAGEFPSFAQIRTDNEFGVSFCGGVIVSDLHIATSLRCVQSSSSKPVISPSKVKVRVGYLGNIMYDRFYSRFDDPEDFIKVEKICRHPAADQGYGQAVLLKLQKRLVFNRKILPACWPRNFDEIALHSFNSMCYQLGIGFTVRKPPDSLVYPLEPAIARARVRELGCTGPKTSEEGYVCMRWHMRPAGSCPYDDGAPLICYNEVRRRWTAISVLTADKDEPCSAGVAMVGAILDRDLARETEHNC